MALHIPANVCKRSSPKNQLSEIINIYRKKPDNTFIDPAARGCMQGILILEVFYEKTK
jgi:hypothetical protein